MWRPSPTVNIDGCYSRVGENRFEDISFPVGGLVSETPAPSNIITVQPGDVVGYFVITILVTTFFSGIQLDTDYNDETVWYNERPLAANGVETCPYPIGSSMTLSGSTNAAPVLSVSISKYI